MTIPHQYIERESSRVVTEKLFADQLIHAIYSPVRENASVLFELLTSSRASRFLSYLNYDNPVVLRPSHVQNLIRELNVDMDECVATPEELNTPRKLFERRIKFWECRPMPEDIKAVVSPADARMIIGAFCRGSSIQLKGKFFSLEELIGINKPDWFHAFHNGDFAVFRLTPDKYHYNHVPVSGEVVDIYEIDGKHHSCNPQAVVTMATPFSKNKRTVTVIDTDVNGGTQVGLVMMIEVVALMIGQIDQQYSAVRYESPVNIEAGVFLKRGQPKSVYRPGSSVDVVIFQKNRIRFDEDISRNAKRNDVSSRYSIAFKRPLVETDVKVRSGIARKV